MCGLCGMPSNGHVWSVHVSHTCDATHLGSPIASSCAGRKSTLGRRDRSENCLLCEPHTIDAITCHRKAVCAVLCCAVLCCLAANVTTVQHRLALHRGTLYSCSYVGIASATICYICYIWVRMSAAIAMPLYRRCRGHAQEAGAMPVLDFTGRDPKVGATVYDNYSD
jgi:hypothetical protein